MAMRTNREFSGISLVQTAVPERLHEWDELKGRSASGKDFAASASGFGPRTIVAGDSFDDELTRERGNDGKLMGRGGRIYDPGDIKAAAVPGVLPEDGKKPNRKIILINGIMTTAPMQLKTAQALANKEGAEVVSLRNASEGMFSDVAQCAGDKLNWGNNPAVKTAVATIMNAVEKGEPLEFELHSQGAIIFSRALEEVQKKLLKQGFGVDEVTQKFRNISVTTSGGASLTFPDGPSYRHYVNTEDKVPNQLGVLGYFASPGKNAKVKTFEEIGVQLNNTRKGGGLTAYFADRIDEREHDLEKIYLPRRADPKTVFFK